MQPNITISSLDAERLEALIHATGPETATSRGLLAELTRADILEPENAARRRDDEFHRPL
jgi:regulator of nucleoside diphosphate kinase